MTEKEIFENLKGKFKDSILEFNEEAVQPFINLKTEQVDKICTYLRDDEKLQFDGLMNLSGVDYPEELEVVYHLFSYSLNHKITLKAKVSKDKPDIPSVAMIWRTADWHEREVYDLFGVVFKDHPDLRRILLPDDWEGYPLRKDYVTPQTYEGITIPYPEEKGEN